MSNEMFGDYELTDEQQAVYEKIKPAVHQWQSTFGEIFSLYEQHKREKKQRHWKDYTDAIVRLFRLYDVAIDKISKDGTIKFSKHGNWNFYAKLEGTYFHSFSIGITRYTSRELTEEEKQARWAEAIAKAENAYLKHVAEYKGLSKADLGKTYKYTRYNGEVEHHKILGATPRKKLPIYTYCVEDGCNYNLAVDLVVRMKKESKHENSKK